MPEGKVIPVEIHGQRYPIRSGLDPEYVARLATYVDEKMRTAADATSTGDTLRLAVLAALNIADEYFRCRDTKRRQRTGELAERAGEFERVLDCGPPEPWPANLETPPSPSEPCEPCEPCEPWTRIPTAFEFPALRVMAVGSFEPTFYPSESRRRVVCMPL